MKSLHSGKVEAFKGTTIIGSEVMFGTWAREGSSLARIEAVRCRHSTRLLPHAHSPRAGHIKNKVFHWQKPPSKPFRAGIGG